MPADDATLRIVEACRARLDPRVDVGIERIQKRCPELLPALAGAPWRDLLPRTMRERRDEVTAESLHALVELVRESGGGASRREAPSRERLAPVLAELGERGQQGATRWERFKRWLKDKIENRKEDDDTGWIERLARQFKTSEGVAQFITYSGYVDGRPAGVVRHRRGAARGWPAWRCAALVRAPQPAPRWRRRLMLADVARAPLAERPGHAAAVVRRGADARAAAARRGRAHRARRSRGARSSMRRRNAKSSPGRAHRRRGALRATRAPPDEALEETVAAAHVAAR